MTTGSRGTEENTQPFLERSQTTIIVSITGNSTCLVRDGQMANSESGKMFESWRGGDFLIKNDVL